MNIDDTHRVGHARRLMIAAVCSGALVAVSGGAATATTVPPGDSAPADSAAAAPVDSSAPAEPVAFTVTVTDTSIDGLPDDLVAGVVDVTVTDEAGREVDFFRVEPGTDPATFATDLAAVAEEGQPFPDYFLNNSGVIGHGMITVDEGEYIVWADPAEEGGDFITAPLTVGPGDNDAVIPPSDGGSIRAGDYLFDADVTGAGSTVTFTNSSDNQFHHGSSSTLAPTTPHSSRRPARLLGERGASRPRGHRHGAGERRVWRLGCVRPWFERHVRGTIRGGQHVRRDVLHLGP
jgi:hypothetical protein